MMNVLHICNGFTTSKLYEELFSRINEYGVSQTVIAPTFVSYTPPATLDKNIKLHIFERNDSLIQRCRFSHKIRLLTRYTEKLDVPQYDLIHAHTLFSDGIIAYNMYRRHGIPYVVAVRNSDINFFFRYFIHKRSLAYDILLNSALIICVSPIYVNRLEEKIPEKIFNSIKDKIVVVPNGINSQWIKSSAERIRHIHLPVRLIFCGSIEKNKNVHSILKASALLNSEGISNNVVIIGKRPCQNDNYLKYIERILLRTNGVVKERMERAELIKEYACADVFVMPSFTETFGLVYAEALSQGLPILYTKNEGFDGFFPDGEIGKAVSANKVHEIADGIKYIIQNYDTIQKRIVSIDFGIFDWDKISCIYLRYYQGILQK